MSETEFEVEIDADTGLPVVPEGFFWRVEEDRWDEPSVRLMQRGLKDVEKERMLLGFIPTGIYKTVQEMGDILESSRGFTKYASSRDEIPEGARYIKSYGTESIEYQAPVNDETIRERAIDIMKSRLAAKQAEAEWERRNAERQAVKDKYYGDYPPKTLVG